MFTSRFSSKLILTLIFLVFSASAFSQSAIGGRSAISGTATLGYGFPPAITPPDITRPAVYTIGGGTNSGENEISVTTSVIVGTGANRVLVVTVGAGQPSGSGSQSAGVVSSITYNGDPLSLIAFQNWIGEHDNEEYGHWLYYLIAPDTGTHDLVVGFDSSQRNWHVGALVVTNANQSTPIRDSSLALETDQTFSSSPFSSTLDLGMDSIFIEPPSISTIAPNAGQTVRLTTVEAVFSQVKMSTKLSTGNTVSLGWDTGHGGAQINSQIAISIKPAQ